MHRYSRQILAYIFSYTNNDICLSSQENITNLLMYFMLFGVFNVFIHKNAVFETGNLSAYVLSCKKYW